MMAACSGFRENASRWNVGEREARRGREHAADFERHRLERECARALGPRGAEIEIRSTCWRSPRRRATLNGSGSVRSTGPDIFTRHARPRRDRPDELAPRQVQRVDVDRLVGVLVGRDQVLASRCLRAAAASAASCSGEGSRPDAANCAEPPHQVRDVERLQREAADLDRPLRRPRIEPFERELGDLAVLQIGEPDRRRAGTAPRASPSTGRAPRRRRCEMPS